MSLADDFLQDAGVPAGGGSLADAFMADAQGAAPADLPRKKLPPPEPLSFMDRMLGKVPAGVVNNPAVAGTRNFVTAAASPTVGLAQLIANAMPDSTGVPQTYNQKVADMLRKDAEASKEAGVTSSTNKFVGGMASPINLIMGARAAAPAITAGQRAIQGAGIGAVGGATAPVDVTEGGTSDSGKFWGKKGVQTAIGTAGGAVMAPVLGAIGDRIVSGINAKSFNPAAAAKSADQIIEGALKESGQTLDDLPKPQADALRQQVVDSLKQGKSLDVAAALRAKDFADEGISPLRSWVTREPMQFAEEQNVRGIAGIGDDVSERIATGNTKVMKGVTQFGSSAQEVPTAAQKIAAALKSYDTTQSAGVTSAYQAARGSAGKDLDVPLEGLAQDYATTLDRFGDKIPKALQSKFSALGLDPASPANQKKVFTFEAADKLLKDINSHYGVDKPTDAALGQLNAAVKKAVSGADASGGPFAPAVAAARERFQTLDAVPALKAAAEGNVDDRFVQKFVINSPSTPQVQKLAALLREQAPDAYQETRQQIGAHLARAAFGENISGDKTIAQESYNRALRNLGTGKLEAFFEPGEIEQMKRLGRVAAYQTSPPAGSASNYSNTASAIANLLRAGSGFLPVGKGMVQSMGDKIVARSALNPQVPVTPNLTPEQRQMMSRALLAITGGAAATGPGVVGQ